MLCCSKNRTPGAIVGIAAGATLLTSFAVATATDDDRGAVAQQETTMPDADLAGIDRTIRDLYDVISGPAGEARDWDRFSAIFAPGATMAYTDQRGGMVEMTPDEYARNIGPRLVEVGFSERETHRVVERFGDIAHAFSTYDGGAETLAGWRVQGINSIQLVRFDDGEQPAWRVHSILWHQLPDGEEIPAKYRPNRAGDRPDRDHEDASDEAQPMGEL